MRSGFAVLRWSGHHFNLHHIPEDTRMSGLNMQMVAENLHVVVRPEVNRIQVLQVNINDRDDKTPGGRGITRHSPRVTLANKIEFMR